MGRTILNGHHCCAASDESGCPPLLISLERKFGETWVWVPFLEQFCQTGEQKHWRIKNQRRQSWRVYTGSFFAASRHPGRAAWLAPPPHPARDFASDTGERRLQAAWRARPRGLSSSSERSFRPSLKPEPSFRARRPQDTRPLRAPADPSPAALKVVGGGASQSRAVSRPMSAHRVVSGTVGVGFPEGLVWAGRRVTRVSPVRASPGLCSHTCLATRSQVPGHGASGPATSPGVPVRPIAAAALPTAAARGPAEDGAGAREGHLGSHRGGPEQGERPRGGRDRACPLIPVL